MVANLPQYFPVVGGIGTWSVFLVAAALGLGALGLGLVELAVGTVMLGCLAHGLLRSLVVEIAPRGLTRGFVLNRRFLGRTTVMAWSAIASVHTDWRRPGDDTAIATTVRDSQGRAIHFTTAMGLRAYWSCLGAVAARAPTAARSGLTEALVSREPPGRSDILSAAATAGALALFIVALVGIHYLWAQGPSTLARYLEQTEGARAPLPASPDR